MIRIILLASALSVTAFIFACGSPGTNNSNVYLTNANSVNVLNNANVPATTDNPIEINANSNSINSNVATATTPGIPAVNSMTPLPKGATPTPGIPDPKTANKMVKPGVTPTPGIPDQETIRRQLQGMDQNMNVPSKGDLPTMMMRKGAKRPGNVNQ